MPTAFTPASRATAVRLGYRIDAGLEDDDPADRPGGRGFGRLQLPGCVDLTEVAASWRGSKLALADVLCSEGSDRKPFATAAVQLCSDRPAAATTTARQRARAELWRMTLLQALSSSTAAAARAGLKVDVSFNARGVRLLVSGYAQRLPQMVDLALRRTLRHAASEATAPGSRCVAPPPRHRAQARRPAARDTVAARDELARVKLIDVNQEIREPGARHRRPALLAAIDYAAAEAAASVRQQVAPLLQARRRRRGREALPDVDFADESRRGGLLYKPEWSLLLAGNLCVDPAISTPSTSAADMSSQFSYLCIRVAHIRSSSSGIACLPSAPSGMAAQPSSAAYGRPDGAPYTCGKSPARGSLPSGGAASSHRTSAPAATSCATEKRQRRRSATPTK